MNMYRNYRGKLATHAVTIIAASGIAAYAIAAPDYDRIRKDINVMIGVVKSTLDNSQECRSCNIRVTGHYLADQGVVFNVDPSSGYRHALRTGDFADEMDVFAEGMAAIPIFVREILTEVQVNLENEDFSNNLTIYAADDEDLNISSRQAKQALREAHAGLREAIRELREVEIEAIHASKEELKALKIKESELEKEVSKLESREEEIKGALASQFEKKNAELTRIKAERAEKKLEGCVVVPVWISVDFLLMKHCLKNM